MVDDQDLQINLPNDQWEHATAPEGQLYLAMRRGEFERFTPNLSADSVELGPDETLEDPAYEALNRLRRFDDDARVVSRSVNDDVDEIGTIFQHVEFNTELSEENTLRLAQLQLILRVPLPDEERRVALMLTLTAEAADISDYADDFEAFVRGVEFR
ncbi:hypothetical protein [Tessaracoccus oleiagri]|uniref:DUF1795 domain-containing protein n=1 Tax=Tessaracoccus oleiagri TaxID=686624 RepID=A0A1G9JHC7_9ACTN|nr:hypothetical protein [Tessaracoccus oleiagri]SDL36997.1 hypothetical protein SAMN04488242_1256 [Tessaracoccus oleiagri]